MSAFTMTCPRCNERYVYGVVGTQVIGGHTCAAGEQSYGGWHPPREYPGHPHNIYTPKP